MLEGGGHRAWTERRNVGLSTPNARLMKDALIVAALVLVEALLFLALRLEAEDRRARLEGIPSIAPPVHPAWSLVLILPAVGGAAWLVSQQDWVSAVLQLLVVGTGTLTFYLHTRRLVVRCVPADQVSSWVAELGHTPRAKDRPPKITNKWQESRSVTVEIPTGSRRELLALREALLPLVRGYPSPGPWKDPNPGSRIARPVIMAIMVLFPLALLLTRLGI